MRRMYSVKELSEIIYAVVGQYIEDGAFDETIEGYILDYIAEHPIDPTAITGLDIAPKDVTASGNITAPSIIETMAGYSFTQSNNLWTPIYVGACKNGNKITMVFAGTFKKLEDSPASVELGVLTIPSAVGSALYPFELSRLDVRRIDFSYSVNTFVSVPVRITKGSNTQLNAYIGDTSGLTNGTTYYFRYEVTFLLSENLAE